MFDESKSYDYNDYCFSMIDEDGKQSDEPIVSICFEGQHEDALVSSIYRVGKSSEN
jgi:hypothetical protein